MIAPQPTIGLDWEADHLNPLNEMNPIAYSLAGWLNYSCQEVNRADSLAVEDI